MNSERMQNCDVVELTDSKLVAVNGGDLLATGVGMVTSWLLQDEGVDPRTAAAAGAIMSSFVSDIEAFVGANTITLPDPVSNDAGIPQFNC